MIDQHAPPGGAAADLPEVYGVLGEFTSAEELIDAAHKVREAGYTRTDAFAPLPIRGLAEALGFHRTRLPLIVLLGGALGGVGGYFMQYWMMAVDYPMNIGGRPAHSWPSFIPVTFELTVLGAALAAVLGMLALNGLPRPHHPLFNAPRFSLASQHRFFICIEAADARFELENAREFLKSIGATQVTTVEY
ncbi:MAG: DUF3341 domain-containing protein [Planctomycetota bacterium]|nr:MAG: DUF3341 domain-containing protein [Planctomycetota bacterium]